MRRSTTTALLAGAVLGHALGPVPVSIGITLLVAVQLFAYAVIGEERAPTVALLPAARVRRSLPWR